MEKSEIKVSAGFVPLVAVRENLTQVSLQLWWFIGIFDLLRPVDVSAHLCIHLYMASPHAHVCVQISPFYNNTSHVGLKAHSSSFSMTQFNLTNCIWNDLISK